MSLEPTRNSYRTERTFPHTFCATASHGTGQEHRRFVELFLLQQFSGTGPGRNTYAVSTVALIRVAEVEIDLRIFPHSICSDLLLHKQ